MMSENKEARDVFLAVLALNSAEEQNRYLDHACRNKPELRQRVEILLREHQRAGSFLDEPARLSPGPTVVLNSPVTEKAGGPAHDFPKLTCTGSCSYQARHCSPPHPPG